MLKELPDIVWKFLSSNHVLHLATISSDKKRPQVATVFYVFVDNFIYFLMRPESIRIKNISVNNNVALVITDASSLQTLQIDGMAEIIEEPETELEIIRKYSQIKNGSSQRVFHPVMKTKGSSFKVVKSIIKWFRYSDFSGPKQFMVENRM